MKMYFVFEYRNVCTYGYDGDRVGDEAAIEGAHAVRFVNFADAVGNGGELARLAEIHNSLDSLERIKDESGYEAGRAAARQLLAE